MKFSASLALASLVTFGQAHVIFRTPSAHFKRDTQLDVKLESVPDNPTGVNIAVTNKGDVANFFNQNNILDDAPSLKYAVTQDGAPVPFLGMWKHLDLSGELDPVLTTIEPGKTVNVNTDAADIYDLREGGQFSILAEGTIPYASANGTAFAGVASYKSNVLELNVDSNAKGSVKTPIFRTRAEKRTLIDDDEGGCSDDQQRALDGALATAGDWSRRSADAIDINGDARFELYFGPDSPDARTLVAQRFSAVAEQVDPSDDDSDDGDGEEEEVTVYCTESRYPNHTTEPVCESISYAFSVGADKAVILCGLFDALPVTATCSGGNDKTLTLVHEMTHQDAVFGEGATTDDIYGGTGFAGATSLDPALKTSNADNYAIFAQQIGLNC